MHSAFMDAEVRYTPELGILNAAHAAELVIKAIISRVHPLLIFKDIFSLDDKGEIYPDIDVFIERGKTHDFEKLPQVLWIATGQRIPNLSSFEQVRKIRNAIQHFCSPEGPNLWLVALTLIYTNIDPLLKSNFGVYAIENHNDSFYDHLVASIVRYQIKFSIPDNFDLTEVNLRELLHGSKPSYREWLTSEMKRIGRLDLLSK